MSIKVAINGLGRIGRAILKRVSEEPGLERVAVNDLVEVENLAVRPCRCLVGARSSGAP